MNQRPPSAAKQQRQKRATLCQLGCDGHEAVAVARLHGVRVCQAHYKMIDEIVFAETGEGLPTLDEEQAA
jgi:hypothetical protein